MNTDSLNNLDLSAGPIAEHLLEKTGADSVMLYRAENLDSLPWLLVHDAWRDKRFHAFLPLSEKQYESAAAVSVRSGALVAASLRPNAFGHADISTLETFAPALSALIEISGELERTRQRLAGRGVIERAKGVVQARDGCTEEEAYAHLRRLSRTTREPMQEIARRLIERNVWRSAAAIR